MSRRLLGQLKKGQCGKIVQISPSEHSKRLMEMGLLEGSQVEVLHEAPFGGDPVAVRVRGAMIALRRSEANQVEVMIDE